MLIKRNQLEFLSIIQFCQNVFLLTLKNIIPSKITSKQANKLWSDLIDSDFHYGKSALMISSELSDGTSVGVLMSTAARNLKLDFNLQDHNQRTAFILACQGTGLYEDKKETVHLYLKNAVEFGIDLRTRDKDDKDRFQYLSTDLIEEFRSEFPQYFTDSHILQ